MRAYDSQTRQQTGSFGLGWRLTLQDMRLESNVPSTKSPAVKEPYRIGTRVTLTLPDGRRAGFTFAPHRHEVTGLTWYTPAWQADDGVDFTLNSADGMLTLAGDRLYDFQTAQPYDPASGRFTGSPFTLTGPDGTSYELGATGTVRALNMTDGTRIVVSDAGMFAEDGQMVRFERDSGGRIVTMTGPDDTRLHYVYDDGGRLIRVRQSAEGTSTRYAYDDLDRLSLIAPSNGAGSVLFYGDDVTSLPLKRDLGTANQFTDTTTSGLFVEGEPDYYAFSIRQSEIASTRDGTGTRRREHRGERGQRCATGDSLLGRPRTARD